LRPGASKKVEGGTNPGNSRVGGQGPYQVFPERLCDGFPPFFEKFGEIPEGGRRANSICFGVGERLRAQSEHCQCLLLRSGGKSVSARDSVLTKGCLVNERSRAKDTGK